MKKLVALLMALVLALSCTAALAEEAAAAGTMTGMYLSTNSDYLKAMVGAMDPDGSLGYAQALDAALQVLDNLGLYFVSEDGIAYISAELGETVVATLTGVNDENGVTVVSSLFPHYAIRAEGVSLTDLATPTYTFNGQEIPAEELTAMMQQISTCITPYLEDAQAISSQLTPTVNEDGSVTLTLTTQHLAALWTAMSTRLSSDTAMQSLLQTVLDAYNQAQPAEKQVTLPVLVQGMENAAQELSAMEETEMGDITVYTDETTGEQQIVITAMDSLYLQLTAYINESNHQCVEILAMTDSSEAESWEDVYNAITSGENTEDLLAGLVIELTDSETGDMMLYMYVDGEQWDISFGGTTAAEDYNSYAYLSVNPGTGTKDGLITLHIVNSDMDKSLEDMGITAPSVEGLTVLNATAMSDEDAQLVLADMQNYGLATLLTNAQTAMPEQVALLLTLLTSAQQQQ